jgi:hypothetical protein
MHRNQGDGSPALKEDEKEYPFSVPKDAKHAVTCSRYYLDFFVYLGYCMLSKMTPYEIPKYMASSGSFTGQSV